MNLFTELFRGVHLKTDPCLHPPSSDSFTHVHTGLNNKDGSVFPRPGLAEVPHVQHMGTMNESWAFTSPPSGMAMVGQPGGGPIKHLSGLGALVGFARAFEPRSSTGAVRGSLSPEGSPVWGPYGGEPLLAGAGASALAPHVGGTSTG